MQKLEKNASILLWSIFLSLTISIAFISISTQISKNLKENNKLSEKINVNTKKENAIINAIQNKNFESVNVGNNEILVFEKNNFLNIGLKNNEEIVLKFNNSTNITIVVNIGSPITYSNTSIPAINGIVSKTSTFPSGIGDILIKNIGNYSNIDIYTEDNFEKDYKKYKIIKKVGNKNIIKESSKIKIN